MRNSKSCPKCGGTNIRRVDGEVGPYGAGNNIILNMFSSIKVNRYICCGCGFTEEWIDEKDIEKLENSSKAKQP